MDAQVEKLTQPLAQNGSPERAGTEVLGKAVELRSAVGKNVVAVGSWLET